MPDGTNLDVIAVTNVGRFEVNITPISLLAKSRSDMSIQDVFAKNGNVVVKVSCAALLAGGVVFANPARAGCFDDALRIKDLAE